MNDKLTHILKAAGRRAGMIAAVVLLLVAGFLLHALIAPGGGGDGGTATGAAAAPAETGQEWTCSMHPQIRGKKGDTCPICSMDLVPVKKSAAEGLREFATSEAAAALMDIRTAPVVRRLVTAEVRMVGKVDYDETRLEDIAARVPGRLDRLYVDYTGVPVKKGDHMVSIYSPALLAAQEELIQAARAVRELGSTGGGIVRETTRATLEAAREKLRLLGLTKKQVTEIEKSGKPSDHLTIYAPAAGIVIHKHAEEGMYVDTGTRIYTVADLSVMWVRLDAYESDLPWIHYGQDVAFTTESCPGRRFTGRVSFIDPVLDRTTRTITVRLNVPNEDGLLKPGMFVRAVLRSQIAAGGKVMAPGMAGKWICPMHPSVVEDTAGDCAICGMPLAGAATLGYATADPETAEKPLVIPASAPLVTGERAVVYVEIPGADRPAFAGREIVLGPRAGDWYLVRSGLKEGETVVTRGNFKIDSALQIEAKPSMMNVEVTGEKPDPDDLPSLFVHQAGRLAETGRAIAAAVRKGDRSDEIRARFAKLGTMVEAVDAEQLAGRAAALWYEYAMRLSNDAAAGRTALTPADLASAAASLKRNVAGMTANFRLESGKTERPKKDAAFARDLAPVFKSYLRIAELLAGDTLEGVAAAAANGRAALENIDRAPAGEKDRAAWKKIAAGLKKTFADLAAAKGIAAGRRSFDGLSEQIAAAAGRFGSPLPAPLYRVRCPMAFDDRGAVWLQDNKQVANPYFGASMLRCGAVEEVYESVPGGDSGDGDE